VFLGGGFFILVVLNIGLMFGVGKGFCGGF
jgi:hypothetical protein